MALTLPAALQVLSGTRLAHNLQTTYFPRMNAEPEITDPASEPLLARARRAYREHYQYGYWRTHPLIQINEGDIPFVIDGLRRNGGHKEWSEAQALVARR